jgi:hypothetical protein
VAGKVIERNRAIAQVCAVYSPHLRDCGHFECNRDVTTIDTRPGVKLTVQSGEERQIASEESQRNTYGSLTC